MEPLKDIRVLGVTVFLAGPFACMNFAALGAEVIKIEIPGTGDPVRGNGPFNGPKGRNPTRQTDIDLSTRFLKRSQGVKSVTLNLRHPEGRQMFLDLAAQSDVILENLAPGSMKRLGLGFEDVAKANEGIVYCSISGYGHTGQYSDKPAHDPQIQGMSGIMDINGAAADPPTRVGFYIGDLVTPLYGCYAILAALRERDRTGKGQHIDLSMIDTLTAMIMMENLEEDFEDGVPLRQGNNSRGTPTGQYTTKDGDITLTVASDDQWRRMCEAMGTPHLRTDPRFESFQNRTANLPEARAEIQAFLDKLTRDEAITLLEKHDVPCGPVRGVAEVIEDRHFRERQSLRPMRHAAMDEPVSGIAWGFPAIFSGGPLPTPSGAPTLGMHNKEIYGGVLHLSGSDLDRLHRDGVI